MSKQTKPLTEAEIRSQEIATEIRSQLGVWTLRMLGVKNIFFSENALEFQIQGSRLCKHIKIRLNGMDTYDLTFSNWKGMDKPTSHTIENIYCDQLHDIIEEHTDLRTRL